MKISALSFFFYFSWQQERKKGVAVKSYLGWTSLVLLEVECGAISLKKNKTKTVRADLNSSCCETTILDMERRKCFLSPFPSSQSFTCSAPRYISKNISFYIAYIYIFTVALQDPTINSVFIILLCIYLPLGEWGVILFANEDACQGCRSSFTRGPKQTGEGVLRGESHTTGRPNMATKMAGNLSRCIHKGTRRAPKLFRGTEWIFLIFSVLVCVFISKASFLFKIIIFSLPSSCDVRMFLTTARVSSQWSFFIFISYPSRSLCSPSNPTTCFICIHLPLAKIRWRNNAVGP